jgi:hypothetical protein
VRARNVSVPGRIQDFFCVRQTFHDIFELLVLIHEKSSDVLENDHEV